MAVIPNVHSANGVISPIGAEGLESMDRPNQDAAELSAVFCTGQLAGMMFALGVAEVATADLPEESWTLRQQLFRKVMPVVFALSIITLCTAFATAETRGKRHFGAAGTFLIGTIADTMIVNVPINVTISAWKAGAAPEAWRLQRDKLIQAHWFRTACGTLSFALSAAGMRG